ncbi:MAG: c-type cytochrome [Pedosphaera sp.]|nr:c-type cytochrome [Pedosphaera sp.]
MIPRLLPTIAIALGLLTAPFARLTAEDLKAHTGLPPFQYSTTEHPLPSYLAGEKWGTEGKKIHSMQEPLSPADSARHIVLPQGFEARLFAAEPDIVKPITLAWDERGRLWIAETIDYPNERQPEGAGRDRIKICEDTDGDGKADKFIVFADKLTIPTAMVFANGGLIVIEGGRTLFLKDTDGDNRADERRVLFKGWGMGDTHATASNLRYGFDHWIWGVVGYSGFDGDVGGRHVKFGMGVYRFKADGSAMEFVRSSNNNTWGLGLSEDGTVFGSTANNNASWYMAIPNRYYEQVQGWSATRMETIADDQRFYPVTEKVRQVDAHGRYTAGAGHALYTARSFPREFWNQVALVTEPTGHLIGKFRLESKGADFSARNEHTFLASDDEWFAPILAEVGPDGAVWMIDWYNYIIQHNPVPVGFKNGKGNAYETPLRDKSHGRIYQIRYSAGSPTRPPTLRGASPGSWVAALQNENLLWRMHAQRLLVEKGGDSEVPALLALARTAGPAHPEARTELSAATLGSIHALWTLHGLGELDGRNGAALNAVRSALRHLNPAVRQAAVQVLPASTETGDALISGRLLSDSDAQVRLAAFLALAQTPSTVSVGNAIHQALAVQGNWSDRWLREAATCAAARHESGFLAALLADALALSDRQLEVVRILARHHASRGPGDIETTLTRLSSVAPTTAKAFLDGVALGWPEGQRPESGTDGGKALRVLTAKLNDDARSTLIGLATRWGLRGSFSSEIVELSGRLRNQVGNATLSDELRVNAANGLVAVNDSAESVSATLSSIHTLSSPSLMTGLLQAAGGSRRPETGTAILATLPRLTPGSRRIALATVLRRSEWVNLLLTAIETGVLQKTDLARDQWNQLREHPNREISGRARELEGRSANQTTAEMEKTMQRLMPVAARAGDPTLGQQVFEKNCQVCHAIAGTGGRIGPDLTGIGVRPKSEILPEILDPNRSVEANFRLWTATTRSDDVFSGRLDSETETSVEILDTTGLKHVVQRKDIASLDSSNQSIMPGGFEQLPEAELAGLLEFLAGSTRQ